MKVEILGPGCPRCENLLENAQKAVEELGLDAEVVKVTEMGKIMAYGVMSPPAVVVDGKVKGAGRLFSVEEIKRFLKE